MTLQNLEQAVSSTRTVLAHVQPTQLDQPTPCTKWAVRDLINHVVGVQFFFSALLAGNPPPREEENFAGGDFLVSFEEGSAAMIARFADPVVMDETFDTPMGKMTGTQLLGIATSDTFVHGWDLAKATGQNTNIAPDLAESLLHGSRGSFPDQLRNEQGDPFGPARDAPTDAPYADQVAAFLGRTV